MADKDTNKRRTFDKVPTKICQYGTDCYRKNPNHFKELSHPHLESILTESPKGKYRIPDELSMSREVVAEQLKIIAQLYPELESNPPAKQPKKDDTPTAVEKVKAATPLKPDKMASSPPKTKSPATPSGAPSKGNAVADLFAERRARMAKQQQEQKKAEVPPPAQQSSSSSQPRKPTPQTGVSLKKVIPRNIHDYYPVVAPKGKMAAKLAAAAPYNMFFTTITDAPVTHREPLSVTFQELLDPSLGELECSVQMNFMVDIGWLLGHYFFAGYEDRPLLILYGDESPELKTVSTKKPNVTALKVHIATPFGVHHTKMGLYGYTDGSMRVVISTANLYEDDFHNRTQGLWISPRLPALAEDADTGAGESRTGFRESLITYLNSYKFAQLAAWVSRIQRTDFGEVK
uniref:Probable tyrosyl-DNA phosphodiesterase n=1 Tax=Culex pipiens TaxID=7175 RepID=A0A8D8NDC9_CULPI